MASIDLAREFMQREGFCELDKSLELSREFKAKLNNLKGIRCYGDELLNIPGVKAIDPLKVLIGVQDLSVSGYQIGTILRREYKIQVEMEEQNLVLAMFSPLHCRDDWERFYLAFKDISNRYVISAPKCNQVCLPPSWEIIFKPREAFFAAKTKVSFSECKGRISGEMVAAYPPGIPCLIPGELITEETWEYLNYLRKIGAHIQGPEEANLEHIKVIE
jgi:lysine decarboxylase